jgi:hypothetical protein
MAFSSVSGNKTTVTGSETTASAFAASINSASGDSGTYIDRLGEDATGTDYDFMAYRVSNLGFDITGTMTHKNGSLMFDSTTPDETLLVESGGTLTIGEEISSYARDTRCQVVVLSSANNNNGALSAIRALSGGTLNVYGVNLYLNRPFFIESGATARIKNGRLTFANRSSGGEGHNFRILATDTEINGLDVHNGAVVLLATPTQFDNVTVVDAPFGLSLSGNVASNGTIRGIGFRSLGNDYDVRLLTNSGSSGLQTLELVDPKTSFFDLDIRTFAGSNGLGICKGNYRYDYTITNAAGTGLANARIYTQDTDNGSRNSSTRNGVGDFSADITNNAAGNGSGVFSTLELTAGIRTRISNGGSSTSTSFDDRRPLRVVGAVYGYLELVERLRPGASTGSIESRVSSVDADPYITEATAATVAAYTTKATVTIADLYDYSAYDKTTETGIPNPSIFTRIVESSDGLNASNRYDLVIDSTAGGIAVDHGTNTATVKNLSNGTFSAMAQAASTTVDLVQNGTQSATLSIPATGVVTVADGASNLVAWEFASGAEINLRSGASAATVTVAADQVANITAGSGVTLASPPTTVQVTVTGPSDYYVTIAQSTTRLNTSDTGLQAGVYSFETSATGSATVRVRRQGWRPFLTTVSLDGGTVAIAPRLAAKLDVVGGNLWAQSAISICNVVIDPNDAAHRIDIGDGTCTVQAIFDKLEDASVSTAGMLVDNLVDYGFARIAGLPQALGLPLSIKVRRAASGDVNSGIRGAVFHAADAPLDATNGEVRFIERLGDWSDDELAQIRYGLYMDGTRTAPTEVGPGRLWTESDISSLVATLASSGVFSTAALANAPAGGGDATEAKQDIIIATLGTDGDGLTSIPWNAAWDAEVQSEVVDGLVEHTAPTTAEFNARTLASTAYFDPASDTVARVTLVDTTTANTDMRGTDGANTTSPLDSTATQAAAAAAITAAGLSTLTGGDIGTALTSYGAATATDITDAQTAITAHTLPLAAQLGLVSGVTATHTPTGITVSSGPGSTTITDNGSESYTVEGA